MARWQTSSRRSVRWAAAIVVVVALIESAWTPAVAVSEATQRRIDPAILAQAKADPTALFDVIVEATRQPSASTKDQRADRAGRAAKRAGGAPHRPLGIVGGASATLRGSDLNVLANDSDVEYIYADAKLKPAFDPQHDGRLVTQAGTIAVNAPTAWKSYGAIGRGIGVAVLDSGIYAHPDLVSRVVAAIDFTSASPLVSSAPLGDPGGHGTHVAGLVAGDGTSAGGAYVGVAPGANLIDVRVLGATGMSSVSTVLSGLQWVLNNRSTYNIRVVNLSLGAPEQTSYTLSPLSTAVEVLFYAGINVVVAAGNSGSAAGTITTPGDDPFVITVAAVDDNQTSGLADDSVATWSSVGPTRYNSLAKPDLAAPGRRMVSLRSPGSTLDLLMPERRVTAAGAVTPQYFTLSGTSMAAPMVSGAVALLLERNPTLTPRQVKRRLTSTAQPLSFGTTSTRGAGLLDAYAALYSNDLSAWRDTARVSNGFAQLVYPLIYGKPLSWNASANGGVDSRGRPWSSVTWADITWDSVTWEAITWDDITWDGVAWNTVGQQDITWDTTFDPLTATATGWSPLD